MIRFLFPVALVAALPAYAQDAPEPKSEPLRVRFGLGAQIAPKFPGAPDTGISPYPDFAIARGSDEFEFEAPDEPFGFPVVRAAGIEFGPSVTFEGKRRRRDIAVPMDEVGFSLEAGGFAQLWLAPAVRLRVEGRRGVTGHRAWVGSAGIDYVVRDGDNYVFSIGPRVNLSDARYQRAYFGVNPDESTRTGLPVYRPDGGVHSVSAVAGGHYALGGRWGVVGYVRYDRLVDDAADSPFIAAHGSRDQGSAGLGLTYTFGRMR